MCSAPRRDKSVKAFALVATSIILLTGCTPVSSAYISNDGGTFVLTVPAECAHEIDEVVVKYLDEQESGFENMPTVWAAKTDSGRTTKEIALFQLNEGFTTEQFVTTIDTSRDLIVWWSEKWGDGDGDGVAENSLIGTLNDVEGDNILWSGGVGSVSIYEREVGLPWASIDC